MAYNDGADSATDGAVTYSDFVIINGATVIDNVTGAFDVAARSTVSNSYGTGFTSVTGAGASAQLDNLGLAYNDGTDSATDGTTIYNNFATINGATAIDNVTGAFDITARSTVSNSYGTGFTSVTGAGASAQLDNLGLAYNDGTDSATDGTATYSNFAIINGATAIDNVTGAFDVAARSTVNNSYGTGFASVTGAGTSAQLDNLGLSYNDDTDSATNGTTTYSDFAIINGATSIDNVTGAFDVATRSTVNNSYGTGFTSVTGAGVNAQLDNLGLAYNDGTDSATDGTTTYNNFARINGASAVLNANNGFNASGRISGNSNIYGASYTSVQGSGILDNITDFNVSTGKEGSITYTGFNTVNGTGTGTISSGNLWTISGTDQGNVDGIRFTGFKNLTGSSGNDAFTFNTTGNVTGVIDGLGGSDTLDFSQFTDSKSFVLNSSGNLDGFAGVETSHIKNGFNNINEIKASTAQGDSLQGINAAATWNVGSTSTYTSSNSLAFTNFEVLTGGSSVDKFSLGGSSFDNLTISGNGGLDSLVLADNVTASSGLEISIEEISNEKNFNLNAPKVTIIGATKIASGANPLLTNINTLEILDSDADTFINEADGVDIASIDTGSGNFSLTTLNGSITNNGKHSLIAGDVQLTVNGANSAIASDANPINLVNSGSVLAEAKNGNGGIFLTHNGDLNVASIDANSGSVTLQVVGSILDASGSDTIVDIKADGLNINNSAAIGRSLNDSLNIDVTNFSLFNNSQSKVFISDASGDFRINSLDILGDISIQTAGDISGNGALRVEGNSYFDAGANPIFLRNGNNDFNGTVSLNTSGLGGFVSLVNVDQLSLAESNIGGGLRLDVGGDITQTGNLIVGGVSDFDSGANSIVLNSAGNDFQDRVLLNSTGVTGDVELNTTKTLTLTTALVGGDLNVTAGDDISLGNIAIQGNLNVNSAGDISQTAAMTVAGNSSFTTENRSIVLNNVANEYVGNVSFNTAASSSSDSLNGNVDIVTNLALVFASSNVAGNLNATANGSISQVGSVVVAGESNFDAGENSIALTDAGNDFTGALSASAQGEGSNISIVDRNALILGNTSTGGDLSLTAAGVSFGNTSVNGNLNVVSSGFVGQTASLSVGGLTTLNSGNSSIALNDANNLFDGSLSITTTAANASVSLVNSKAVTLASSSLAGDLSIQATGGISQNADLRVAGNSSFNTNNGDIVLDRTNNDFVGAFSATNIAGANVVVVDANGLRMGEIVAENANVELTVVNGSIQSAISSSRTNITANTVRLNTTEGQVGGFDTPVNITAVKTSLNTETGGFVIGNYGELEIIAGLFVDPLSNARIAASQQNTNLRDVVFIDAGLFSQNLSLFNSVGTGIRLPADQLEEELEEELSWSN